MIARIGVAARLSPFGANRKPFGRGEPPVRFLVVGDHPPSEAKARQRAS